jgi:ABC-2 type transport system permease protein
VALPDTDTLPLKGTPAFVTRLAEVIASEWTKIRSVRSTFWLLLVAGVTALGGSTIVAMSERSSSKPPTGDPVASIFLAWLEYPVLAVGILGVLSFTSEYATGQIRTTFAAIPQRLTVLAAKASVTGLLALIFGEATAFASFLLSEAILAGHHDATSLSHPRVLEALLAAGFCLFAIAILGLALGAIIRHTAGAVAALPALIYLPLIVLTLPHPWNDSIGKFTLLMAAYQLVSEHQHTALLSQPLSLAVVVAWPAAALLIAAVLIQRRDA